MGTSGELARRCQSQGWATASRASQGGSRPATGQGWLWNTLMPLVTTYWSGVLYIHNCTQPSPSLVKWGSRFSSSFWRGGAGRKGRGHAWWASWLAAGTGQRRRPAGPSTPFADQAATCEKGPPHPNLHLLGMGDGGWQRQVQLFGRRRGFVIHARREVFPPEAGKAPGPEDWARPGACVHAEPWPQRPGRACGQDGEGYGKGMGAAKELVPEAEESQEPTPWADLCPSQTHMLKPQIPVWLYLKVGL